MTDVGRHDRRNARCTFATGGFGFRTRAIRVRTLPTEHGHAALPLGVTCGYQSDSASKRPTPSVTLFFPRRNEQDALPGYA